MYKFVKLKDKNNEYDNIKIKMSVETDTLSDLLEAFSDFLKASGFNFKGEVIIYDEEEDLAYSENDSYTEETEPNLEKEI